MEELKLEIKNNALIDAPIYESHKRGRNWLAVIIPNPRSPGGLERKFIERANGDYYYMIDGIKIGDAVEFGADYYSGSGNKSPNRWYGVVKNITEEEMILLYCENSSEAIQTSDSFVKTVDRDELIKEKERLLKRIEEIDKLLNK